MLDMGFEPQVRKICTQIARTDKLSSGPPLGRDLCKEDPVHICIGSRELKCNHSITQHVDVFDSEFNCKAQKKDGLMDIIYEHTEKKAIIFADTKKACDE